MEHSLRQPSRCQLVAATWSWLATDPCLVSDMTVDVAACDVLARDGGHRKIVTQRRRAAREAKLVEVGDEIDESGANIAELAEKNKKEMMEVLRALERAFPSWLPSTLTVPTCRMLLLIGHKSCLKRNKN